MKDLKPVPENFKSNQNESNIQFKNDIISVRCILKDGREWGWLPRLGINRVIVWMGT